MVSWKPVIWFLFLFFVNTAIIRYKNPIFHSILFVLFGLVDWELRDFWVPNILIQDNSGKYCDGKIRCKKKKSIEVLLMGYLLSYDLTL